jgi:hypothetical protein
VALCELVVFDSDKEMVVHLERLEGGDVDFHWLIDTLGVPVEDVIAALLWPNNLRFTLGLFTRWCLELSGSIPGAVLEEDPSTLPPTVIRRAADIPMPATGFSQHDDAFAALLTIHIHHLAIESWIVPKEELWLPRTPTTDGHLARLVTRGPSKNRCVSVRAAVFPHDAVQELGSRVTRLEAAVAKLSEEVATWAARRLAFEHARRVLLLLQWQWTNAPRPYERQDDALGRIDALLEAMARLDTAADEAAPSLSEEQDAARDLLFHLSPLSSWAAQAHEALEIIATQPTAFRGEEIEDILSYLERAFLALSQCSLASEFVAGHVMDMLRVLAESLAPELETAFADAGDGAWSDLWAADWAAALDVLKADGFGEKSPWAALAKVGKYYKSASAIILGAINQGTLPLILGRLAVFGQDQHEFSLRSRSFATTLLRGVLASAAVHRGAPGQVLIGGKDMTRWFRACARALSKEPSAADLDEIAEGLRELQLGGAIAKTRLVGSVGFVFGAVSTLVACGDTWDRTWLSSTKLAASLLKSTSDFGHVAAAFATQREAIDKADDLVRAADQLSMMSTVVSFVVTTGETIETWAYLSKANKFARVVSTLSATTALMRLLPFVKASAGWARVLGVVGVVLAVVDGIVGLVLSLTRADSESIFGQYFDFALASSPYRRVRPSLYEAAIEERDKAVRLRIFVDLRGPAGERGVIPHGGLPTWNFANGLGFPAEVVARLFDVDVLDVISAGLRTSPDFEAE